MHIYSEKIIRFVREISSELKSILRNELHMRVSGSRVYDRNNKFSYPISVVIFNDRSMLGYFDSEFFELGFHQCLMGVSKQQLRNTIRHELAHFMIFLEFGHSVRAHGPEFRSFCRSHGWGEDVFGASTELDVMDGPQVDSRVVQRVKKLMALSSSKNGHEAELAMLKAQQLLLRHNIDSMCLDDSLEDSEEMLLKRILKQGKRDSKMRAIATILGTFFVSVVFSRAGKHTYLEILGTQTNVEIAEYVADFLNVELDALWLKVKREYDLKGLVAKNSFFLGIANGYCDKVDRLKAAADKSVTNALTLIENKLEAARNMAYRGLSYSTSQSLSCPLSSQLGKQAGKALSINPAVSQASNGQVALLT